MGWEMRVEMAIYLFLSLCFYNDHFPHSHQILSQCLVHGKDYTNAIVNSIGKLATSSYFGALTFILRLTHLYNHHKVIIT